MVNKAKQKRRLRKAIAKRQRVIEKEVLSIAWRNIFVKAGVLNGES
ncbi:DUF3983 domain-containing protein [Bacillus sp. ISL-46]|nr:DUF3983 domain-containing protein [Bacillus sp. ISL-46]MBT2722291.1 DUF3983 domain-containing protein [Bacillus sp. ISL-46]